MDSYQTRHFSGGPGQSQTPYCRLLRDNSQAMPYPSPISKKNIDAPVGNILLMFHQKIREKKSLASGFWKDEMAWLAASFKSIMTGAWRWWHTAWWFAVEFSDQRYWYFTAPETNQTYLRAWSEAGIWHDLTDFLAQNPWNRRTAESRVGLGWDAVSLRFNIDRKSMGLIAGVFCIWS